MQSDWRGDAGAIWFCRQVGLVFCNQMSHSQDGGKSGNRHVYKGFSSLGNLLWLTVATAGLLYPGH